MFKAILGLDPKEVRERAVISPVIYPKEFGKKVKARRSLLGYFVANFKEFTFIKTPMTQGAVYDAVLCLRKTRCREVVFVGAAGGLARGLKIGDQIETGRAKDIYSVNCLHEETRAKLVFLKKKGVLGIDFESRVFFKAAKEAKLKARAYLVVTDLPLSRPFYNELTAEEKGRIRGSIAQISMMLLPG